MLDTGIVLGYVRGAGYAEYVDRKFAISVPPNIALVSVITIGEIYSIALQLGWQEERRKKLRELIKKIPCIDISAPQILNRYAEIDAYSQGKHPSIKLPQGITSRNMGENDIWIAATGSVSNATLLTVGHDFNHLDGVFLEVEFIDQGLKGSNANA